MTTHTITERDEALPLQELPPLSGVDRLALAIGTRLILRAERHQQRPVAHVERARTARSSAAAAARGTFEHRVWAGPTW